MSALKPFPTDEPIRPEERLIGRGTHLEALERRLLDQFENVRLAGERRIGKTSVGQAICDRARARDGWWVVDADLSKHGPLTSAGALAAHLADGARSAGIKVKKPQAGPLRKVLGRGASAMAKAPPTGDPEVDVGIDVLSATVAAALAPKEHPEASDLREVMRAIDRAATSDDRRVLLFLDETQRLASKDENQSPHWVSAEDSFLVQEVLAECMREPENRIQVFIAGSEPG